MAGGDESLKELIESWRALGRDGPPRGPKPYASLGERIIKVGEPLLAYDALAEGLGRFPRDPRLRQLTALALANSGAPLSARAMLEELRREGREDEETLGLLARTCKDLAARAAEPAERAACLRAAHRHYARAFRLHRGYYAGVNAAATALLLGRRGAARALARTVRGLCARALARAGAGADYWLLASLGECALIRGEIEEAERWYLRAAGAARGRHAQLSSTRRQARLLLGALGAEGAERIERCFAVPKVLMFASSGAGRPLARLPPGREAELREELSRRVAASGAGFAYAAAAGWADILFLEAAAAAGAELSVVLPLPLEELFRASADLARGAGRRVRLERALSRAARVVVANERGASGSEVVFEYAGLLLSGLAKLRALALDTELAALAVADGDGSAEGIPLLRRWRACAQPVELIRLGRAGRERRPAARRRSAPRGDSPLPQRIMAIVFADAVGYSQLREAQVPVFATSVLELASAVMRERGFAPAMKNTWGDALYLIFADPEHAALFALELVERVARVDWPRRGFPEGLSFRLGLHAGPVFCFRNPITGGADFTGSHVSRTARIEPITPPGQVYASQEFAALAAARGASRIACGYVGQVPLAKKFGSFPLYAVRRAER